MNVFQATYMGEDFQISGQSFACPQVLQTQLQLTQGQRVDLGIRPEHIAIARDTRDTDNKGPLTIEVNVVEPLGRETLIRGSLPESQVVLDILASSDWRGCPGDRISIQLDFDRLFLFDPTTGDALYP